MSSWVIVAKRYDAHATTSRTLTWRAGGKHTATPPTLRDGDPPLAGRGDADGGEAYGMDPEAGRAGGTLISHGRAPPTLQRRSPWPSGTSALDGNLGLRTGRVQRGT
jgi:hypothetical protein